MCGIFGWQLSNNIKDNRILASIITSLAFANEKRGDHSYGWSNEHGEIHKDAVSILKAPLYKLFHQRQATVHTRFATQGTVSAANAHPFLIGNIIGSHNGVIYNHHRMNQLYQRNFPVDSQHIFAHISEQKPLSELTGYGAIQFFEKDNPNRIKLVRFYGGSLSIYGIKQAGRETGVVWSSTEEAITEALTIAGVEGIKYKVEMNRVYLVEKGGLYVLNEELSLGDRDDEYSYGYHGSTYPYNYPKGYSPNDYSTTDGITYRDKINNLTKSKSDLLTRSKTVDLSKEAIGRSKYQQELEEDFKKVYAQAFYRRDSNPEEFLLEYLRTSRTSAKVLFLRWLEGIDSALFDDLTHLIRNQPQLTGGDYDTATV